MTPNQYEQQAAAMMELYADAEQRMIEIVARRLARGVEDPGWAERKLREMRDMQSDIRTILRRLASASETERNALLTQAYTNGWESAAQDLRLPDVAMPESRVDAIARLTEEMDERFDAQHSAILRDVRDEYRHIVSRAVAMQTTGATSTQESIRNAMRDFARRGITSFTDRAGRTWDMASYAEMATRTGMMNAALQGYKDDALAHDEDLVIISDHNDSCPLCADWERTVLSISGASINHPDCDGLLDDATAAGLFHPNCLHSFTVYVPGLTDRTGSKERQGYTPEQSEQGYSDRQRLRYMERQVRAWKREQAAAKGSGDAQGERKAYAYVNRWRDAIEQHTARTGLVRMRQREGGRVTLSEAAKRLTSVTLTPIIGSKSPSALERKIENAIRKAGR